MEHATSTTTRQHGQSVVELAIAMPLLLVLLLGTIDAGRVFAEYIQMRNAAVEGATFGSRHPFDNSGIATAADEHGMPDGAVVSSSTSGQCNVPRGVGTVIVTASKTYTPISVAALEWASDGFSWSFDVNATATMRCLT